MLLYKYKGDVPNFGDDLNDVLWPSLLPDFFDDNGHTVFLGTGSILYENEHFKDHSRKIVCGAGYGGYTGPPVIDDTWNIYFVRGPRTAETLGLEREYGIGDSGSLVREMKLPKRETRWNVSFIPHWESLERGAWDRVVTEAGIHLIDPRKPPMDVIAEILASGITICEAMHGAIVSDALRVPWIPVLPLDPKNRMKWFDWAEAMEIPLSLNTVKPSTPYEWLRVRSGGYGARGEMVDRYKRLINVAGLGFVARAARSLRELADKQPYLSSDVVLDRAVSRMQTNIARMRKDASTGFL